MLKYSHFDRFSNWLCSVIDNYILDATTLLARWLCTHSTAPTATSVRYKVGCGGGIVFYDS